MDEMLAPHMLGKVLAEPKISLAQADSDICVVAAQVDGSRSNPLGRSYCGTSDSLPLIVASAHVPIRGDSGYCSGVDISSERDSLESIRTSEQTRITRQAEGHPSPMTQRRPPRTEAGARRTAKRGTTLPRTDSASDKSDQNELAPFTRAQSRHVLNYLAKKRESLRRCRTIQRELGHRCPFQRIHITASSHPSSAPMDPVVASKICRRIR
jgi:hypothetical protein